MAGPIRYAKKIRREAKKQVDCLQAGTLPNQRLVHFEGNDSIQSSIGLHLRCLNGQIRTPPPQKKKKHLVYLFDMDFPKSRFAEFVFWALFPISPRKMDRHAEY